MLTEYSKLQTEDRNVESTALDEMSTLEAAKLMNRMDREVPEAVEKALPEIVRAVDMAAAQKPVKGRQPRIYLRS